MPIAHPSKCPKCGSSAFIPIHYGVPPDPRSWSQAVKEGRIKPGGPARKAGSPDWFCKSCRHEWR